MNFSFYFEDGLGNVDENGNEPMNITEDEDPFKLEELRSYSTYPSLRTKLIDSEAMHEIQEECLIREKKSELWESKNLPLALERL